MENKTQLLPVGSVIRLRKAKKNLMIFGVCQTQSNTQKTYDYIGVLWPEGNMGAQTQVLFYHDDIEDVVFMGYDTPERHAFLERLNAYYETQK